MPKMRPIAHELRKAVAIHSGETVSYTHLDVYKRQLVDYLADDYEMGARIANAGYRVELCSEIVETTVPAYRLSLIHI